MLSIGCIVLLVDEVDRMRKNKAVNQQKELKTFGRVAPHIQSQIISARQTKKKGKPANRFVSCALLLNANIVKIYKQAQCVQKVR